MLRPQRALAESRGPPRTNLGYDRIAGFEFRSSGGGGGEEEEEAAAGINSHLPPPPTHSPISLPPSLSSSRQASGEIVAVQRRPLHASHGDGGDERKGPTDGRARRGLSLSSVRPLCCAQSTFQAI